MNTITLPRNQYKTLVNRQEQIERELALLREIVKKQAEDNLIYPRVLKRWERISSELDHGKGRVFMSRKEVRAWFKGLYA